MSNESSKKKEDNFERTVIFKNRLGQLVKDDENQRLERAKVMGVSAATFSRIVNYGLIPHTKTLMKIADYFEVSISYLLGKTDDESFFVSQQGKNFYERLEELKAEKNLKRYADLANETLLPRQYFNDWQKRNVYPTIDTLEHLERYFEVSIDYLLGRTDDK